MGSGDSGKVPAAVGAGSCTKATMNPFCGAVGDATLEQLCRSSRQLLIKKGSFFSAADISSEVLVIKSGVVTAVLSTEKGKSQGIFMGRPGYVVNIMRVAGDTDRYETDFNDGHFGCAFTDVRACAISLDEVRRFFREDSSFAWRLFVHLSDRYKDALRSMTLMTELSGAERIAWLLDELSDAGVDVAGVTHETIGRLLGMNRVSVTRLMGSALELRKA